MEIEIRYTLPKDELTLEDFFEAYDAEPDDDNDFYFGWSTDTILKDAIDYYQTYWVGAFDGDKIIGICSIREDEEKQSKDGDKALVLSDTYVLPDRRRKGVGTALVKETLALAETDHPAKEVHITLLDDDLVAFYERFNFVFEEKGLGYLYY